MREQMKPLDDLEMGDLWERARTRVPGSDGPEPRSPRGKRGPTFAVVVASVVVLGLVVWALGPLGHNAQVPPAATPEPVLPLQAKVTATIPIRSSPSAIAAGAGSVWVAAPLTRFPMDNGSVARIDPSSNDVVDRIAVPQAYGDIADVAADATSVWVTAVRGDNEQTLGLTTFPVNPTTDRLGAPIDGVGGQLAVSGDTLWALAAGTDATPTQIVRIDAADGAILSRAALGGTGTDIVLGDRFVYVPILTGGGSVHDIAQIDASTGELVRTISLAGVYGTYEVPIFASDAPWIPVCCTDNTVELYRVDPSSGEVVGDPISVDDGIPFGSAFGNILSMSERGRLDALDPVTGTLTPLAQSEWPASHTSMVYDPSTQAVWVANYKDMVTRIDLRPIEPASLQGYWVAFPDAPTVTDTGIQVVATTNLPDGTLYLVNTPRSGTCCPAVQDGQIVLKMNDAAQLGSSQANGCTALKEGNRVESDNLRITILVDSDIGKHIIGTPVTLPSGSGEPGTGGVPKQPDSVLSILGEHFENLSGDQITQTPSGKQLEATVRYPWPTPRC